MYVIAEKKKRKNGAHIIKQIKKEKLEIHQSVMHQRGVSNSTAATISAFTECM